MFLEVMPSDLEAINNNLLVLIDEVHLTAALLFVLVGFQIMRIAKGLISKSRGES